jgi:hypothetical protein
MSTTAGSESKRKTKRGNAPRRAANANSGKEVKFRRQEAASAAGALVQCKDGGARSTPTPHLFQTQLPHSGAHARRSN